MVKKILIGGLATVFATGVLCAFYGFKGYSNHGPEVMIEWKMNMISKELALNEEQRAKLEEVKLVVLEKWNELKENRNSLVDPLAELVGQDQIDQEALNNLIVEHRAAMSEMIPLVVASFSEFHATLNEEQKIQLSDKIKNHSELGCHSNKN